MAARPTVSVLTAARDLDPAFLLQAYDSLRRQDDVDWEWLIQLDGEAGQLPPEIDGDERVLVAANGRRLGTAGTRNRALLRSRCELIQNLDADDQLLPGALQAGAAALAADETLAFAFGRTVHLLPDGTRDHVWQDRVPHGRGRIEPGSLDGYWLATGNEPLPMSPIMWRRPFLYAFGGWAALPVLEDTALVFAVASRHPCWYLDCDTQLYRVHPQQATVASDYRGERRPNLRFVFERLRALAELDGRLEGFPQGPPPDPADRLDDRALRRGL